jgi:hypothetical protein
VNRLSVAVLLCVCGAAVAQETPPPPPPGGGFENPYAPPAAAVASTSHAGSFGIKAGFGATVLPANLSAGGA